MVIYIVLNIDIILSLLLSNASIHPLTHLRALYPHAMQEILYPHAIQEMAILLLLLNDLDSGIALCWIEVVSFHTPEGSILCYGLSYLLWLFFRLWFWL